MIHDLILFDLDGTISDPLLGVGRSINHALSHFGYAPLPMSDIARFIGPPLDETFVTITGSRSDGHIAALVSKYRERYSDPGYAENTLYPGITGAIESLAGAGFSMAICTSKRADFAERILDMFGLLQHFQFVDGGNTGIQKWEQIAALRQLGKVSDASIMVGDRAVDMIAAHRNGLSAAGVLWGYGSHVELSYEKPLHLFVSPEQLVALAEYGSA